MKYHFSTALLFLLAFMVAAPAYGQVNLGTSSSVTNPERSGDATTGLFSSTTGAVSISSAGTEMMHVNGTGVGINTTSPQTLLTINKNASGVPTPSGSAVSLQLTGADSAFNSLEMEAFGDNSTVHFIRYDGTFSSPTALQSADGMGSIAAGGYNGSAVSANKAGIIFAAGGNWSSTSTPSYISFGTTAASSTTKTERIRIDTTGNVGIGTTSPANPLTVNGVIDSLTGGFTFPDGTTQTTASTSGSNAIQSVHVQKFTSSGTYTPSAGMAYASIEVVGAGGGGGGANSSGNPSGDGAPGGGGGGYGRATFSASSIGSSQTVTIGAGGAGGAAGFNAGSSGGTTSVGSLISASGGAGGSAGTSGSGAFGSVATGGAGGSTISGATVTIAGQAGSGGGGGSTQSSNGIGFGGPGGNSALGLGGAMVFSLHSGQAGTGYGGGGGGAASSETNGAYAGGAGAGGAVIITEYCTQ